MTFIEGLGLFLAVFIVLELILFVMWPDVLLSFSRTLLQYDTFLIGLWLIVGGGLLYILLQELTLIQIMATVLFGSLLYEVALLPYGKELLDAYEEDMNEGNRIVSRWVAFLAWGALAVATIVVYFMG